NASRHSKNSGEMLRVERQMESDEKQPKLPLAERLAEHFSRGLWKPIIECTEQREHQPAYQNVMKMRYHEIRIGNLPVEWNHGQHHASKTRDQKLKQKADTKEHRCIEPDLSAIHSPEPVEDFDSGREADSHRNKSKEDIGRSRHSHAEHVMGPHTGR